MTRRRDKGEGSIYQRHDHPTCPPLVDGPPGEDGKPTRVRPKHTCKGRWAAAVEGGAYVVGTDGRPKRIRRVVTAATKRELLPKLERAKAEVAAGVAGEKLTVSEWLDVWHRRGRGPQGKPLAPRTLGVYRTYIDQYVTPALGRKPLTLLRAHDVRDMLDWMEGEGHSGATQRQAYSILRRALEVAHQEQRVVENVAARITRPSPGDNHHEALTVSQARTLLAACPTSADLARWSLALMVGLRQGEALGLRWEDVHLDDPIPHLFVHQQAQRIAGQGVVIRPSTKSARPRMIALTHALAPVVEILRTYRTEHGGTGFLFRGDSPVNPRADWGTWRDQLAACGLPTVPLHGARATAEQWMDEAGVPLQTRSDTLGHATSQITQTVYHRATLETIAVGMSKSKALD